MVILQQILVYLIVLLAVAYIVKKFFLPKTLFATKKKSTKGCGENDCGCH